MLGQVVLISMLTWLDKAAAWCYGHVVASDAGVAAKLAALSPAAWGTVNSLAATTMQVKALLAEKDQELEVFAEKTRDFQTLLAKKEVNLKAQENKLFEAERNEICLKMDLPEAEYQLLCGSEKSGWQLEAEVRELREGSASSQGEPDTGAFRPLKPHGLLQEEAQAQEPAVVPRSLPLHG